MSLNILVRLGAFGTSRLTRAELTAVDYAVWFYLDIFAPDRKDDLPAPARREELCGLLESARAKLKL